MVLADPLDVGLATPVFHGGPPAPLGAFLGRVLYNTPGTAEPSGYAPAKLVAYGYTFEFDVASSECRAGTNMVARQL